MEISFLSAFKQLINFLEDLESKKKVKYFVVGGILTNIYSDFRITRDIDFVVDIDSVNISIDEYVNFLKNKEFQPIQDWKTAIFLANESNFIQFLDKQGMIKFDNYFLDKFSKSKYKRIGVFSLKHRVRETLFDTECWIISKEDFIISKLVCGGWQDYTDALGCWIRNQGNLKIPYMEQTCRELEIKRELELLISGIDDPDEFFNKMNQ